ncbi:uncharacterized protein FRV6_13033 [Fusarium oxysporum]|uniref:HAT C-terminal dimerisation domain-containing protein n=1 Tax=Fusarium oxysporum TaxID=5507 RepID=A0A2H3TMK5_FUSOX|nr:uncharacterized protein FRV6_13033 [Fusarium oxysporum]
MLTSIHVNVNPRDMLLPSNRSSRLNTRNRHALYGVTAVLRDTENRLQKVVLGIPELVERHTGENIAAEILEIIRSFSIEDKVGYFTLDNASNNETAMSEIAEELKFDPVQRQVRCMGHILNLVVKSLLFGKDVDAFEKSLVKEEPLARASYDQWMRKGPIGKAHNFVPVYEEFLAKAKRLFRDARKGEGKRILPPCLEGLEESSFINESDWAVLRTFDEILSDFHVIVQVLQGDGQSRYRSTGVREAFGSMTDVLESFEFLRGWLEDAKSRIERHPEPEQFCVNINLGWKKLDKYYNTLRDSPAYYAAVALHPSLRWDYFDEVWGQQHPGWVDEAKEIVQRLWDTEYRDLQIAVTSPEANPPLLKRMNISAGWQASVSGSDKDVADPVEYWVLKRSEYPRLSRMALDVMTVPAMSSECERLFSTTGLMVTPLRNRLDAGRIGLIQTLRSWLRASIIEDVDSILLDDTALQEAVGRDGLEERQE